MQSVFIQKPKTGKNLSDSSGRASQQKQQPVGENVTKPGMPVFLQSKSTDSVLLDNESEQEAVESSSDIQPKLTIGAADDPYEKEADAVADKVMRMPESKVQRQPEPEEEEEEAVPEREEESTPILDSVPTGDADELGKEDEEEFVQAKSTTGTVPHVTSGIANNIQSLKGSGQPLPASERAFFEARFGTDFGSVRVHNDTQAARAARSINARAFTLGRDVVFGAGQYSPRKSSSRRLLAHELTHVVQQGKAGTNSILQRFAETPHKNIGKSVLGKHFSKQQAKEVQFGNWQTDINQISLLEQYLNFTIPLGVVTKSLNLPISLPNVYVNLNQFDLYEIAKILAEAKFGSRIVAKMDRYRFGKYRPEQHFDNPHDKRPNKPFEATVVPTYIRKTSAHLKGVLNTALINGNNRIGREYLGNALHIMEDFFAHTNFVRVARKVTGKQVATTYGGKHQGKYRLVSGLFEKLDTVISMLKIIQSHLKKSTSSGTGKKIVLVLFKKYMKAFYQRLRQFKKKYPRLYKIARWIYRAITYPSRKIIKPVFNYIAKIIKNKIAWLIGRLTRKLTKSTGTGVQPSHSKLNKDDPGRLYFKPAKQLATVASRGLTAAMVACWRVWNKIPAALKYIGLPFQTLSAFAIRTLRQLWPRLNRLVDKFTAHPQAKGSTWWKAIIRRS